MSCTSRRRLIHIEVVRVDFQKWVQDRYCGIVDQHLNRQVRLDRLLRRFPIGQVHAHRYNSVILFEITIALESTPHRLAHQCHELFQVLIGFTDCDHFRTKFRQS